MIRHIAPHLKVDMGPASARLTRHRGEPLPVTTLPNVTARPVPWSVQRQTRLRFERRRTA